MITVVAAAAKDVLNLSAFLSIINQAILSKLQLQ